MRPSKLYQLAGSQRHCGIELPGIALHTPSWFCQRLKANAAESDRSKSTALHSQLQSLGRWLSRRHGLSHGVLGKSSLGSPLLRAPINSKSSSSVSGMGFERDCWGVMKCLTLEEHSVSSGLHAHTLNMALPARPGKLRRMHVQVASSHSSQLCVPSLVRAFCSACSINSACLKRRKTPRIQRL